MTIVLKKLVLAMTTVWLLSILVFFAARMLPGNVGRAMLGPFADQTAVDLINTQLGTDRPYIIQYTEWLLAFIQGNMGQSYTYREAVAPFVFRALANSAKLAIIAFIVVVPLSILFGCLAALHVNRPIDRIITTFGMALSVVPEFVSGLLLMLLFGVTLRWFPVSASLPEGAGLVEQLHRLTLPALPLVLILFGYIARMTRAGMIEALDADYTRTAHLKGLPWYQVIYRHVLRNALIPTVSVITTQTVYLIGGLVVVETLFRYQGLGSLIYVAAQKRDFPMLQAGVMMVGICFTLITAIGDGVNALLNPRIRLMGASR